MAQLLEIRRKLRSGEEMNHNLTGSYLRKLWESEKKDILHLSLVASLDGVSLSGNTSQKIWPITLLLVDIPTAQMQRASNLAIHGLAEGPVNPSTFFYNTVVPMIYADIEGHTIERGEMKMKFFISTWIGDQPFFRISFGLAALVNPTLKPEARLVIASLMLITNQLYTDAPMPDCFHSHLTGAARWFLEKASPTYMSTKAHELLSHLPSVITKFGNIATLSTFSFEHYYKYCLKGFNPQKTNGFTSAAISRVILHSSVRREIELRSACNPSPSVIRFLKETPSLSVHRTTWKDPIVQLDREHDSDEIHEYELFGTLNLSIGRLKSYYVQKNTKDDVFFASTASGGHVCFRFLAACVKGSSVKVYAQRVRSVCPAFESIRKESYEMAHPANQYSYNVMTKLWRYGGIVDGTLTDERELLETSAIKGVGAYLQNGDSTIYLQVNGACIHH
uniref:BTB domain-containing protein n=1 Tax=Caenorhabditis tropicalis TaxID=1561998 RepID=A0A1I7TTV4_9PELO